MTTTHRTIAASKLAEGMVVRREIQGVPADYRVVSIVRQRDGRKAFTFAYTEPVDTTHANPLGHPALYTSTNKPVIKIA